MDTFITTSVDKLDVGGWQVGEEVTRVVGANEGALVDAKGAGVVGTGVVGAAVVGVAVVKVAVVKVAVVEVAVVEVAVVGAAVVGTGVAVHSDLFDTHFWQDPVFGPAALPSEHCAVSRHQPQLALTHGEHVASAHGARAVLTAKASTRSKEIHDIIILLVER